MLLKQLSWDSTFFAKKIWRLDLESSSDLTHLYKQIAIIDYDVIYVMFSAEFQKCFAPALGALGALYVDCRVTYEKRVPVTLLPSDVRCLTTVTDEIRNLAYASGHLSRFQLDKQFQPDFERLYDRWVEKAIESCSGVVLGVLNEKGDLAGMVTAEIVESRRGKIGLIAIKGGSRGKGFGSKLLMACDWFYTSMACDWCEVVTQEINFNACRLYQRNGYAIKNRVCVWHLWRT